jgi:hypothetical protein
MAHLLLKFYQSSENHTNIFSIQLIQHHPVGIASFLVEASFHPQEVSCVRRSKDNQIYLLDMLVQQKHYYI